MSAGDPEIGQKCSKVGRIMIDEITPFDLFGVVELALVNFFCDAL
jgi:hypothetical protein